MRDLDGSTFVTTVWIFFPAAYWALGALEHLQGLPLATSQYCTQYCTLKCTLPLGVALKINTLKVSPKNFVCDWQVRLYDEDLLKSDDDLGLAMVSMAALEPGKPQDLNLELKGKLGEQQENSRCAILWGEERAACVGGD